MPSTNQVSTFTHQTHFTLQDRSLEPHRPEERRYVPGGFIPISAKAELQKACAEITFDYTVDELPRRPVVQLANGVVATFGKYTRKLLLITISYEDVNEASAQVSKAMNALKSQKRFVPQDSIKRNYDMAIRVLGYFVNRIIEELPAIKETVSKPASE